MGPGIYTCNTSLTISSSLSRYGHVFHLGDSEAVPTLESGAQNLPKQVLQDCPNKACICPGRCGNSVVTLANQVRSGPQASLLVC